VGNARQRKHCGKDQNTRCAFHSGRYPQRLEVGLREPLGDGIDDIGLPENHPTIASLMKANGYETTHVTYFMARPEQKFRRVITKLDSDLRTAVRKIKKGGLAKKDVYEGEGK